MDVYGKIWNERRMVIRERVLEEVPPGAELEDETLQAMIDRTITELFPDEYIRLEEKRKLRHMVFNSIRRMDVLQDVLEDETITEIMVNGPHHIFVEQAGRLYETGLSFEHQTRLENIVQQIASRGNRIVNESNPILDARLEDGSRVNIVVPPIALEGPVITIRKFPKEAMTMEKLLSLGALTKEACEFLQKLVIAKYNIFISGGTGAGKTTFLNVLSNFIPKEERVITIEDSAELQIRNISNLVSLETRNANTSGRGEITIRDLIRSALRMRPERIIVGEVRGAEALDMLQAMNTGHDGSLSTGHANSTRDMLSRLETMVLQGNAGLPLPAIRQQISSALDIVIHLSRLRDKSRRTMEITEILGCSGGEYQLNPLFVFQETQGSTLHKVQGRLMRTGNSLKNDYKLRLQGMSSQI